MSYKATKPGLVSVLYLSMPETKFNTAGIPKGNGKWQVVLQNADRGPKLLKYMTN